MEKSTKEVFYENLGNRIRNTRIKQGYSGEQLSEMANISTKYLYQIEHGHAAFSTDIFIKICHALNVSPDILLPSKKTDIDDAILFEILGNHMAENENIQN